MNLTPSPQPQGPTVRMSGKGGNPRCILRKWELGGCSQEQCRALGPSGQVCPPSAYPSPKPPPPPHSSSRLPLPPPSPRLPVPVSSAAGACEGAGANRRRRRRRLRRRRSEPGRSLPGRCQGGERAGADRPPVPVWGRPGPRCASCPPGLPPDPGWKGKGVGAPKLRGSHLGYQSPFGGPGLP